MDAIKFIADLLEDVVKVSAMFVIEFGSKIQKKIFLIFFNLICIKNQKKAFTFRSFQVSL